MHSSNEWSDVQLWLEVEKQCLYPPEATLKPEIWRKWASKNDFRGKHILDLGCGSGMFGSYLKRKGGAVTGIDMSEQMIKVASEVIEAVQCDCISLPFEDNSFDIVVSSMLLHVVEDIDSAVSEMNRVLGEDGVGFIGIVHPESERWDIQTRKCFTDVQTLEEISPRTWVFNLTDGNYFTKQYIHRPWSFYENVFGKYFEIGAKYQLSLPLAKESDLYAAKEYLFFEIRKK